MINFNLIKNYYFPIFRDMLIKMSVSINKLIIRGGFPKAASKKYGPNDIPLSH